MDIGLPLKRKIKLLNLDDEAYERLPENLKYKRAKKLAILANRLNSPTDAVDVILEVLEKNIREDDFEYMTIEDILYF